MTTDFPIFVCAPSDRAARDFVATDLRENPRRLRYIYRPDQLQGLEHFVLYIHPRAHEHRYYNEIRVMAAQRGAILAHIDDTDSRARYARRNRQ